MVQARRKVKTNLEGQIEGHFKFIYSEKATKFCEISTVDVVPVKSTVEISQNFIAFSEYMNFTYYQNSCILRRSQNFA